MESKLFSSEISEYHTILHHYFISLFHSHSEFTSGSVNTVVVPEGFALVACQRPPLLRAELFREKLKSSSFPLNLEGSTSGDMSQ
jgi:hypothetical protein